MCEGHGNSPKKTTFHGCRKQEKNGLQRKPINIREETADSATSSVVKRKPRRGKEEDYPGAKGTARPGHLTTAAGGKSGGGEKKKRAPPDSTLAKKETEQNVGQGEKV